MVIAASDSLLGEPITTGEAIALTLVIGVWLALGIIALFVGDDDLDNH